MSSKTIWLHCLTWAIEYRAQSSLQAYNLRKLRRERSTKKSLVGGESKGDRVEKFNGGEILVCGTTQKIIGFAINNELLAEEKYPECLSLDYIGKSVFWAIGRSIIIGSTVKELKCAQCNLCEKIKDIRFAS